MLMGCWILFKITLIDIWYFLIYAYINYKIFLRDELYFTNRFKNIYLKYKFFLKLIFTEIKFTLLHVLTIKSFSYRPIVLDLPFKKLFYDSYLWNLCLFDLKVSDQSNLYHKGIKSNFKTISHHLNLIELKAYFKF